MRGRSQRREGSGRTAAVESLKRMRIELKLSVFVVEAALGLTSLDPPASHLQTPASFVSVGLLKSGIAMDLVECKVAIVLPTSVPRRTDQQLGML